MRRPLPLTLALCLAAPTLRAQPAVDRCAPRVEAAASVPSATVARLTAAVSSRSRASGPCPLVRFDLVGARLVMTVVLDDGRQVARVLPSPDDAMPTLVALTASPTLPEAPEAPETSDAPDEPAVEAPATPVADPPPAAPPAPVIVTPPATPLPPRDGPATSSVTAPSWQLRVGLAGGNAYAPPSRRWQAALDVDALHGGWVLGLRAIDDVSTQRRAASLGASAALSARRRWIVGRWEFDAGPAVGARWGFGTSATAGLSVQAGAEASVAFAITPRWSVFARVEGAAALGVTSREVDTVPPPPVGEASPRYAPVDASQEGSGGVYATWGAVLGARWTVRP